MTTDIFVQAMFYIGCGAALVSALILWHDRREARRYRNWQELCRKVNPYNQVTDVAYREKVLRSWRDKAR